jgi:hypothetical protein
MHGLSSSAAFVSTPVGLVGAPASSLELSDDGKRFRPRPVAMLGGFETEVIGFAKDVITAGSTGAAGDLIAQVVEKKGRGELFAANKGIAGNFDFDLRRSGAYGVFAGGYTGAFQHFLFARLQDSVPNPLARLAINQGLIIPIFHYTLLLWLVPKLRARSQREEETLRKNINVLKMIPRNWAFWVPLQLIQFCFIPHRYQVFFCSVLGFFWKVILSLLTQGAQQKVQPVPVPAREGPANVTA